MSSYDPADGIDWGTQLWSTTVKVYFVPDGETLAGGYTSEGLNAYEQAQFHAAFDLIESVSGLEFEVVATRVDADFLIGLDFDRELSRDTLGFFNPPGEWREGHGLFNGRAWDRKPGGDLEVGGYGFVTIVHELLHGLGLAHPHDRGGTSSKFPGVGSSFGDFGPALLNQGIFTTMSYNSGYYRGPTGTSADKKGFWDFGYEAGPMALDIAVLQAKYGVNTTTGAGNDRYDLPNTNASGTFYMAIWDTGGTDEIRYRGGKDVTIDLRAATLDYEKGGGGYVSGAKGVAGGFTIASGVVIEIARSDKGADRLIGNGADNKLISKGGDDVLRAGGGNDLMKGGGGKDILRGGGGDDTLIGGKGADDLFGGAGADLFVFRKGHGRDTVKDFETGIDRLDFDAALWGGEAKTAAEIVSMAVVGGRGVVWRFDDGERVLLEGLFDTTGLDGSILI